MRAIDLDQYRTNRVLAAAERIGWCDEDCTDSGSIDDSGPVHATGILKIHRNCTPPCPRAVAAMAVLKRLARAGRDG